MLTKVVSGVKFAYYKDYSISFKLLELGGAHLKELGWLDPLSRRYVGNQIGAA